MATIARPDDTNPALSNAGINLGVVQSTGRGSISAGELLGQAANTAARSADESLKAALHVSQVIDQEGQKLFNDSKAAYQTSVLQNKMVEATQRFLKGKQGREKQTVDANGNPTYQSLSSDISSIGDNILKDVRSTIIDPEVGRMFQAKFGEYVAQQKISSLKKGLSQQSEFAKYSLSKNLKELANQALIDETGMMDSYRQRGLEAIEQSFKAGVISFKEYDALSSNFKEQVIADRLMKSIQVNPEEAVAWLSNTSTKLGIQEATKLDLDAKLKTRLHSLDIERAKAKEAAELDNLAQTANIISTIDSKIAAGNMTAEDLMIVRDKLAPSTYKQLASKFISVTADKEIENLQLKSLGQKIAEGEGISDASPKLVDSYFNRMVQQASDQLGRNVTLSEEAQLAASIPTEVKSFSNKLNYVTKYGTPQQAQEAIAAYSYIKDRNLGTLGKGFDSKSTAIMEHAQLLVEKGGVSPVEALQQSRELVLNKPEDIRIQNLKNFNKERSLQKGTALTELAADNLPGAENMFGRNRISKEASDTFYEFLRDGYAELGNKDSAIKYAVQMMSQNYGISEVSGKKEYSYRPPEKILGMPAETIRKVLINEVKDIGILPVGIDEDKISLISDSYTSNSISMVDPKTGERKDIPSWIACYEVEGLKYPVLNKNTHKPFRWTPVGSKYLTSNQKPTISNLENAKKLNEIFRLSGGSKEAVWRQSVETEKELRNSPEFKAIDTELSDQI